ncbi:hypothetical protein U0L90_08705 [Flavobacteriaceae sp. LMIT009]
MSLISTLLSGINTTSSLLDKVLSKRGTRIDDKISAVTSMQKAINYTEAYLTKTNNTFIPNEELSSLWLEAFTSMIKIDKNLAKELRTNSLFWSNPQKWLKEKGAMELVPTLKDLNERCEGILNELERRL